MVLYFHNKLKELRLTYHQFFDTAYYWRYGRQVDLRPDYAAYQLKGELPEYVLDYLYHLQQEEKRDGAISVQAVQSGNEDRGESD